MPDTNREAFIVRIEENQGILHKVCGMFCNVVQDKEDLYQEIILQLWKSWPHFRGDSKLSTWMYRVALNTAITMAASKKKQAPAQSGITREIHQLPDEERGISEDDIQALHQAISTLSEIERAIILLYLEEKPYEEIAEITGLSKTNVGVRILRIKKKLEAEMQKLLEP